MIGDVFWEHGEQVRDNFGVNGDRLDYFGNALRPRLLELRI